MPFTFTHPSIVVPFLKSKASHWFSATGLIIGSLLPDFEYFIRMNLKSEHSHSFSGIFWFNLPLGILLCFVFHAFVKLPLLSNTPKYFQNRLNVYNTFKWNTYFFNHWKIVFSSLIIGITSHIIWDSFTHKNAYFVELLHLNTTFLSIPHYSYLQHGSTLIGGLYLCLQFHRLKTNQTSITPINPNYWLGVLSITFVIIAFKMYVQHFAIGHFIVTAISGFLIAIVICSVVLTFHNRNLKSKQ